MPEVDRRGSAAWRGGMFALIAACIVALDQVTKLWVRSNLTLSQSIPIFGPLSLTNVRNTGSAFGLFVNQAFLLAIIAIAGILTILLFYRYFSKSSMLGVSALSLVFAGAIGNLIDRLRFRYVTDFIDVRLWGDFHWPTFNVADSAITIGSIVMVVFIFTAFGKSDAGKPKDGM